MINGENHLYNLNLRYKIYFWYIDIYFKHLSLMLKSYINWLYKYKKIFYNTIVNIIILNVNCVAFYKV